MQEINTAVKKEIYDILISKYEYLPQNEDFLRFLDKILNLRTLPSVDNRYDNAYDDTDKHIVQNDDWSLEYIFFERFPAFLKDDKIFISFIENLISHSFVNNNDIINSLELTLNPILIKINKILVLNGYDDDGLKILKIETYDPNFDYSSKIVINKIPFIVVRNEEKNIVINEKAPYFILEETEWDDYSLRATFDLYFKKSDNDEYVYIEQIKILKRGLTDENFNENVGSKRVCRIAKLIPKRFTTLNSDFCSLGQKEDYYNILKSKFTDEDFKSILLSLRDIAFFDKIYNDFENSWYFNISIIRNDKTEELSRIIKYKIYGYDLTNLFSFNYTFKPKFSESSEVQFKLDFSNNQGVFSNRIKCLIGKNGTSKTQLVSSLPLSIANKEFALFKPNMPIFSKIITISYSVFDRFPIPESNEEFNYIYCGLKKNNSEILSEDELFERFYSSLTGIDNLNNKKLKIWKDYVAEILNENNIPFDVEWSKEKVKLKDIIMKLSSGQSIMIYIMTELIANIRLNSLLIYDEPETHLHPNAISKLINTIIKLNDEFDSFCLIATHSPLIVRELFSKDVLIMEKEVNNLFVRKPSIETFAENLTVITEDIFNNRDIEKNFKSVLKEIINELQISDYEKILSELEIKNINLSLNARLYLKVFLDEKYKN